MMQSFKHLNNAGTLLLILLGIVGIIIRCVIVPPLQTVNLCRIARLRVAAQLFRLRDTTP